jgi:hypothetical protein
MKYQEGMAIQPLHADGQKMTINFSKKSLCAVDAQPREKLTNSTV